MGLGDKVTKEVMAWGTTGIIVVIVSLIFLKFIASNPGQMTCNTGFTYNETSNLCYQATNTSNTTAINSLAQTAGTFVSAFSEPKNWVAIALIAIVGFGMLYYFHKKKAR